MNRVPFNCCYALFLGIVIFYSNNFARSSHRPQDVFDPYINVYWRDNPSEKHTFRDSHLQEAMFKLYDEKFFNDHLLPDGPLHFRYEPEKTVEGKVLSDIMEQLVQEIKQLKKKQRKIDFKDFNILKMRDTNKRDHTGLYVVEFKDYPFVLKLFVETPGGITQPLHKGFEPICFYYLAGLSRHFNGFSRIKNLENIKKITQADPYWSSKMGYPDKCFWLPKDPQWIVIEGHNIGSQKDTTVTIPGIYGVLCQKIKWEKPFSLSNIADRQEAISLSNFLNHRIDSHINNFGYEIQTGALVPIDFEHFITAVDLPENHHCNNYFNWYSDLTFNMVKRLLFRNKKERRIAQFRPFNSID